MKNKLTIISSGFQNLNAQTLQIMPGPELVIKQKGDKMRKIAMIVSVLALLGTSAQAGGYVCKPNMYGGTTCVYQSWAY